MSADKIYLMAFSCPVVVQAKDRAEAAMAIEAAMSKALGHGIIEITTAVDVESVADAEALGIADAMPLDGYGMTVAEYLAEQE